MNSIEQRALKMKKENLCWSSYMCFAESIRNRGYSRKIISRWFNKLVEKSDYSKSDRKELLRFLRTL